MSDMTSNSKIESAPDTTNEGDTEPKAFRGKRAARVGRAVRNLAMVLALIAGGMHVAGLWAAPLGHDSLLEAGRGVLLILLALGLMGSSRLSVVLVFIVCSTTLFTAVAADAILTPVTLLELVLLALAAPALFASKTFD